MDKKCSKIILILSVIGIVLAGCLTYLHYYPGASGQFIFCGSAYGGNCDALSKWKYETIFHIPLAAYGLLLYLLSLSTMLIANYVGDHYYYVFGLAFVLVLSSMFLVGDIVLAAVMVRLRTVCLLCVSSYLVNLMLFLTAFYWYRYLKKHDSISLQNLFKNVIPQKSDSAEKKVFSALYVLLIFLLAFSTFSTSYILQIKTLPVKLSKEQMQKEVEAFSQQPVENMSLPKSQLVEGRTDAKVQIVVFTDFLCSACYKLFQMETDLRSRYGDRIAVIYYNYPLDQACNSFVQRTVYPSSCTAARAMLSAADMNVFSQYALRHFSRYAEYKGRYSRDRALETASGLADAGQFQEKIESASIDEIVKRDIQLAKTLNIKVTPTLFINGKRMEGAPDKEVMDSIIAKEIKNNE